MVIYYTFKLKDQMSDRLASLSIFSKFDMLSSFSVFPTTLPGYENGMPEMQFHGNDCEEDQSFQPN